MGLRMPFCYGLLAVGHDLTLAAGCGLRCSSRAILGRHALTRHEKIAIVHAARAHGVELQAHAVCARSSRTAHRRLGAGGPTRRHAAVLSVCACVRAARESCAGVMCLAATAVARRFDLRLPRPAHLVPSSTATFARLRTWTAQTRPGSRVTFAIDVVERTHSKRSASIGSIRAALRAG